MFVSERSYFANRDSLLVSMRRKRGKPRESVARLFVYPGAASSRPRYAPLQDLFCLYPIRIFELKIHRCRRG